MTTTKNYIFYKIVCDDLPEFIYVGSTCNFNNRKRQHKGRCNNDNENDKEYHLKLYTTIRDNGGWENWKMIQIHQEENINKRQAETIEEEYRLDFKATLNDKRAYLFPEVKKELKAISDKKYRESDKGKITTEKRADYFKEYNHDPETIERKHQHYLLNKENYSAKAATRYVCDCGKELTLGKKARHEKSQFHLNYIKK